MKIKRVIAACLAAVMVVLPLSGCGNAGGGQQGNGSGHVEVLRIGTTYKNDGYSAMNSESAYGRLNYHSFSQLNLWRFDEEGKLTGDGCFFKKWEISDDNRQVTLHFDPLGSLKWHDGEPVTIEDVLFTFDYYKQQNMTWFLKITSVDQIDDTSIRLNFDDSEAFAFMNEATLSYYILPKHIWENVTESKKYTEPNAAVGCGPYKFVSADEDAQTSYYEAVSDYPLGEITVDKVELKSFDNQSSLIMAMQSGEIDVMYGYSSSLDTTLLPTIESDPNIDPGESLNSATYQIVFGFNQYPTNDLNFRKAVRYALDYELLAQSIGGGHGQIANEGAVSPACLGYDSSLPENKRDLKKATELLDQAGFVDKDGDGMRELPDGSPMNVKIALQGSTEIYKRIAEMLQTNLAEAGIRVSVDEQTISNPDYTKQLRTNSAYEIYLGMTTVGIASWTGIASYIADITMTSNQHFGTYADPAYLDAYSGMMKSENYDEYSAAFKDIQKMNAEQAPGIALAIMKTYFPYRTDKITGWVNYPSRGVINGETWYKAVAK